MRSVFVAVALAVSALAQSVHIAIPTAGQTLQAGSNITVAVAKPVSLLLSCFLPHFVHSYVSSKATLTGSSDIGIGITLHHCSQNPCESAVEVLGSILYAGAFHAQRFADGVEFGEPHENFTVQIPAGFQPGPAVLSVPHSVLVGVSHPI